MKKKDEKGISLRSINIGLIIVMLIMSCIVGFVTFRLTVTFSRLTGASEEHMELDRAARELMEASDYLTESAQRFTVKGDRRFLDQYFEEAQNANRREKALSKMDVDQRTEGAREKLQEAMNASIALMDREYYSMRLVIEAKGYTGYPEVLEGITLSEADAALSAEDKMRRATELVLDEAYYELKDRIRQEMQESLEEVDKLMDSTEGSTLSTLRREVNVVRIMMLIEILLIILMVIAITRLGIRPVMKAVDRIREESPIPEKGSKEFRYMARAYNRMFTRYLSSLSQLNYKASHDELTGAYNRAGYDLLMEGIDLESTYMLLLDVDNFKNINDSYGHETGDRILIKLVRILKSVFRGEDHICRIGGDEFVILMVHSEGLQQSLIEGKIRQISSELEKTEDGLPPISISIGIMHGKDAGDGSSLFEKTDAAMYESKKKGKHSYTFYTK
ncbi:MAG: diguanylate cyclase [Lachnospiraceae bacterium]|nr:diguanylate cyclase [Lachnospiraceae bacterium]